jgi:galactose mutarotase-like enzyme
MSCSIGERCLDGVETVLLENEYVQAELLPELGGRLWNLWYKPTGMQWLWHNPYLLLQTLQLGASYDDNWAGGWEELFPNDAPGEFMGRDLPDHGEWWSQPWQWEAVEEAPERVSVRLWRDGKVTHTHCEKWIRLEANVARLSIRYRITNLETEPLYFLFKQHLAVALTPAHRLELPGGKVTPVDLGFSTRIGAEGPFDWPIACGKQGESLDLSIFPPEREAHREFIYVAELPGGWCGVRDTKTGAALRLYFPREVFPYTWLFMTFGGWRGLYTVVLEPCTNMPKDLNTAVRLGQCAVLHPNETLQCEVYVELS